MNVSFAVTTHNEPNIGRLLVQLSAYCVAHPKSNVVILDDYTIDSPAKQLIASSQMYPYMCMRQRHLEKNFAEHKNYLNSLCTGDYIFQIDADELIHPNLLNNLDVLLEENQTIDLIVVPRINTVEGLTEEDINRWGWNVNDRGFVMFPDYQTRIYRNSPEIKWVGAVHERIEGHKKMTLLPPNEEWAIIHNKTIDKQREQNEFYNTI